MPAKKRSAEGGATGQRKRRRTQAARTIHVEPLSYGPGSSAALGLQPALDTEKLVKSRQYEIAALERAMKASRGAIAQRAFQTVPRHLRRRAASHDARRLPVRLRERARREIAEDATKKPPKRKLRKLSAYKRRRARFLGRTKDLEQRSVKKQWLETHIWHAKRMHMDDKWGQRIALSPTEKSFRPSQRAAVTGALVQDVSYMRFFELKWTLPALRSALTLVCDDERVSPCSARYTNGCRVCPTLLYDANEQPRRLLGPATLLWKAALAEGELATLLVSVHPAMAEEAAQTLLVALQQTATTLPSDHVPYGLVARKLCAFDVTGRRAGEVIGRAIHPLRSLPRARAARPSPALLMTGSQREAWTRLLTQSPDTFPDNMVVGLVASDPRLAFPPRRLPRTSDALLSSIVYPLPETAQCPAFWTAIGTGAALQLKFSKADLDERRSKNLVPGTRLKSTAADDRLPVLVCRHRPRGWTLLAPAGWGMAIWQSLVFAGPRIGAQASLRQRLLEAGLPSFPFDFPGTPAYEREMAMDAEQRQKQHLARPPAKRIPHAKLGTDSPFGSVWPAGARLTVTPNLDATPDQADETKLVQVIVTPTTKGCPETLAQLFAPTVHSTTEGSADVPSTDAPPTVKAIGHITTGGYSLTRGTGHALGAVQLSAFKNLMADDATRLMLRGGKMAVRVAFKNAATDVCRPARMTRVEL